MEAREQLRMRMTRDVLRLLRVRDFRAALPPLRPGDDAAVLVSFRDDPLKRVMEQIVRLGGSANVVVAPADADAWPRGMAFLQVTTGGVSPAPGRMTDDDCLVNENSDLGMLLALLNARNRTMTFYFCRHETTVELVDDGKDLALT